MEEKPFILITNNKKVIQKYKDHPAISVDYSGVMSYRDVLVRARDYVHAGYHLLSHPLASNLKPNQSPVKTIFLSKEYEAISRIQEIDMAEKSIETCDKLIKGMTNKPSWNERVVADFETVDLSVVESAVNTPLLSQRYY